MIATKPVDFRKGHDGLVLTYKRLEAGKFAWPGIKDGVMRLSKAQFEALFEGLDWRRVHGRRVRPPVATE